MRARRSTRLAVAMFTAVFVAGCQQAGTTSRSAGSIEPPATAHSTASSAGATHNTDAGTPAAPGAGPATVMPAVPTLTCRATMSNANPTRNGSTSVFVDTTANATVNAVVHYATTQAVHAATADSAGRAGLRFTLSSATIGFRVVVDITVRAAGAIGGCRTSFTPVAVPLPSGPITPGLPPIQRNPW